MEEFLKDYVKAMAEARERSLNNAQLQSIVNSLQDEESLWDIFDSYVNDAIDEEVM
jgi:hypothetical protein